MQKLILEKTLLCKKSIIVMINPLFYKEIFLMTLSFFNKNQCLLFLLIGLLVISMIDPALANIFAKPTQKAQLIKTGLMTFAKVSVAIAFLACLVGALAGRINWRWVAVVFVVAISIATFDILLGFLEVS